MKQFRIGLFGYGTVGSGFDRLVKKTGGAVIKKIAVKHPFLHPELERSLLAANMYDILQDDEIDIIVEAIDDADAAFDILKLALQHGKPVITANKKMIAEHLPEIIRLQKRFHTPVLYEAACCAGIPVVRTIQDYFRPELTRKFKGIINGSTNYILTAMGRYRFRFDHALQLAQEAGFAERDASLDVEGKDASHKLSIILRHLWGKYIAPQHITYTGIQNIIPQDLRMAEQLGCAVKLVAETERDDNGNISAYILPRLIQKEDTLYHVAHEFNGIVLEDVDGNEQFLYGKGSGAAPTAYGLWADVQALQRNYAYQYHTESDTIKLTGTKEITVHLTIPDEIDIPTEAYSKLWEYAADSRYRYFAGRLHIDVLTENKWWKQHGISLIDISDIDSGAEHELREKLETLVALQTDIFQPV
jgi:homoserine dehydrogenase